MLFDTRFQSPQKSPQRDFTPLFSPPKTWGILGRFEPT
nr:MAG TPA: hypothetical protein [Caudoviricetes sp.]